MRKILILFLFTVFFMPAKANSEILVTAESNRILLGQEYQASIQVLGLKKKDILMMNKDTLQVDDGKAKIHWPVSYEGTLTKVEGTLKQTYTLCLFNKKGDTLITKTIDYYVRKPIVVIAGDVHRLYKGCGNQLYIYAPELGKEANITFESSEAEIVLGKKPGQIVIFPRYPRPNIKVFYQGIEIENLEFYSVKVPQPKIIPYYRGRPISFQRGLKISNPLKIWIKAVPNDKFRALMPKDARFKVTKWRVSLIENKQLISSLEFEDTYAELSELMKVAKPGYQIVIEIMEVKRMNFNNEKSKFHIPLTKMKIPLYE